MRTLPPLPTSLLLALTLLTAVSSAAKPRDAILLSQVESLTLRGDKPTAHRRVSAIPQLKCISHPSLCAKYAIDVMRCENKGAGYDTEDIQWSCSASLPVEFKLGSTDVICEGYSSPSDPYILKGSCGVEYRLILTPDGERKWPDLSSGRNPDGGGDAFTSGVFPLLFWVIFGAVTVFILGNMCRGAAANRPAAAPGAAGGYNGRGGWGGGGGGRGNDDDNDDPPPPYYPRRGGGGGGSRKSQGGSAGTGGGSNWQSNLAMGAAGAAAGYFAGNRGRNNNSSSNNNTVPNYGSSWGSGRGSSSGSSGSSGGSAASSSRHESTGFGSTSRR